VGPASFSPEQWRDFPELLAESLWTFDTRSDVAKHLSDYHGAFLPQIPEQFIQRFTDVGELVLDPMCGSGTTLAVAKHLSRDSLGCDLSTSAVDSVRKRVIANRALGSGRARVIEGDACSAENTALLKTEMKKLGHQAASLLMLHPPYFNIIRFSESQADLSQVDEISEFLRKLSAAIDEALSLVKVRGIVAVVIGDIYHKSAWFPLAFRVLDLLTRPDRGLSLRGVIVKNMVNSRGKRGSTNLWKYRSFRNQTYLFSHEYILVLRKE